MNSRVEFTKLSEMELRRLAREPRGAVLVASAAKHVLGAGICEPEYEAELLGSIIGEMALIYEGFYPRRELGANSRSL